MVFKLNLNCFVLFCNVHLYQLGTRQNLQKFNAPKTKLKQSHAKPKIQSLIFMPFFRCWHFFQHEFSRPCPAPRIPRAKRLTRVAMSVADSEGSGQNMSFHVDPWHDPTNPNHPIHHSPYSPWLGDHSKHK